MISLRSIRDLAAELVTAAWQLIDRGLVEVERRYIFTDPYRDEVSPTVCVKHLRFVPCRRGDADDLCIVTDDPVLVDRVRTHQGVTHD